MIGNVAPPMAPPAGTANLARPEAGRWFWLQNLYRRRRKNRRGAAVVEFAVVAPLFFLLVFGMIEYGRMVMVQQVLVNASREGARVGVLDNATAADVQERVNAYLTSANINGATITLDPADPGSAPSGGSISVTVSVPFQQVSWLPGPLFLGGRQLTATTVMRRETVQ
jgi:Flp pilus assembly pilin Flp